MKNFFACFLLIFLASNALAKEFDLLAQKPRQPPVACLEYYEPVTCPASDGSFITASNACYARIQAYSRGVTLDLEKCVELRPMIFE